MVWSIALFFSQWWNQPLKGFSGEVDSPPRGLIRGRILDSLFRRDILTLDHMLSSPFLNIFFQPATDTWSIRLIAHELQIMNAAMGVTWEESDRTHSAKLPFSLADEISSSHCAHSLGPSDQRSMQVQLAPNLHAIVHFSLLQSSPVLLWRIELKNEG